jgi:hypothetical protein
MRSFFGLLLVVLLGIALGVGIAVTRHRTTPWDPRLDEGVKKPDAAKPAPATELAPKVVVDSADFDFGSVDIAASGGSHEFKFTNQGKGPLKLNEGGTSCRCTMSKLGQEEISPGGSTKVTVTWKPIDKPGPYQQTAKILTNDPATPQVVLTVAGRVTAAMRLTPSEMVFSRLTAGEPSTAETRLYSYLDPAIKVAGTEWANPATAAFYETSHLPLSADQLKEEKDAKSGLLVKVTVKPGMPQGPIHQKLILKTSTGSSLTLPIDGNVGSEIALVGHGWDPDTGILSIGEIASAAGATRHLMLVIRGPLRRDVKFKTQQVKPDLLKVSLGSPKEINSGAVIEIPVQVEIPAGSPPANHLGSDQGKLGEIMLETSHPQVHTLRILVRFAIAG